MNEVVGTTDYFRFVLALILVIGLIGLAAAALRKYGFGLTGPRATGSRRRLSVSEILPLDARHKLVLVRRDDREHLILIGGNDSRVIENGIDIAQGLESGDSPGANAGNTGPEADPVTGGKSAMKNIRALFETESAGRKQR